MAEGYGKFVRVSIEPAGSTYDTVTFRYRFWKSSYTPSNNDGVNLKIMIVHNNVWRTVYDSTFKLYEGNSDERSGTVSLNIGKAGAGAVKSAFAVIQIKDIYDDSRYWAEAYSGDHYTKRMPNITANHLSIVGGSNTSCRVNFAGIGLPNNESLFYQQGSGTTYTGVGNGVTGGTIDFVGLVANTKTTRKVGAATSASGAGNTGNWLLSFDYPVYTPFQQLKVPLLSALRNTTTPTTINVSWAAGLAAQLKPGMSLSKTVLILTDISGTVLQTAEVNYSAAGSYNFSNVDAAKKVQVVAELSIYYHDTKTYIQNSNTVLIDVSSFEYIKDTDNSIKMIERFIKNADATLSRTMEYSKMPDGTIQQG